MNWTPQEKKSAKKLYDLALKRDYERLIDDVVSMMPDTRDDVWELRDFLNKKAKAFDNRYIYRYSNLLNTFVELILDGLLNLDEFEEFSQEKIDIIGESVLHFLPQNKIYRLHIALEGIEPSIYRIIEIKDNASFYDLHVAIQIAFDWENAHLHEFRNLNHIIGDPTMDEFGEETILDENEVPLYEVFASTLDEVTYLYDFGDSWEHTIFLQEIIEENDKTYYPKCVEGKNCRPPEDVGGLFGFENFKEAMRDKRHEEHLEYLQWYGKAFKSNYFSIRAVNKNFKDYAAGNYELGGLE